MARNANLNQLNAKPVRDRKWMPSKKNGLQPGDKLPARRSRRKKYPPLTKEQQALVVEHKWIAARLAYGAKALTGGCTGCFTKDDLESVAMLALCVAATRYDPSLGWKFSTYAWNTGRGWIQHSLRDFSRMVRLPRWISGIRQEANELLRDGMSYAEVAFELGLDEKQVLMCEQSWQEIHFSYDYTPEDSQPREFVYEVDEVRTLLGPEIFKKVGDLPDSDIELLLMHVEGHLNNQEEKDRAQGLLDQIKAAVE